jgi:hypothetical protein
LASHLMLVFFNHFLPGGGEVNKSTSHGQLHRPSALLLLSVACRKCCVSGAGCASCSEARSVNG